MGQRGDAWWWAAFGLTLLALAAPFAAVDVPPVLDYPNHLARFVLLAAGASRSAVGRVGAAC